MMAIVWAEPLRGGILLRIIVALGHLFLMSLISASYLAMILPAGCLAASLPATWSITRFGLAPSSNMLLILLCVVGISAPGYAKHVAFTSRAWSLGPSPRTNEVPIITVSGSCDRFEMGSSAGLAGDSSCWLVEAFRAAAPISTTGMGCGAAVGRDHVVGSGRGVALDACASGGPPAAGTTCRRGCGSFGMEVAWSRLDTARLLCLTVVKSSGGWSSRAPNKESVIAISFMRSSSYLSHLTLSLLWVPAVVFSSLTGELGADLVKRRTPVHLEISRLSLLFSFASCLISFFWTLFVFLSDTISDINSSTWFCRALRSSRNPCISILAATPWASNLKTKSSADSVHVDWRSFIVFRYKHICYALIIVKKRTISMIAIVTPSIRSISFHQRFISHRRTWIFGQLSFLACLLSLALFLSCFFSALWTFLFFLAFRCGAALVSLRRSCEPTWATGLAWPGGPLKGTDLPSRQVAETGTPWVLSAPWPPTTQLVIQCRALTRND